MVPIFISHSIMGPSHGSLISLVPHLTGSPSHWSLISLVPQLAPMHHQFHWSPIYLASLDALVPHLTGSPSHWSPISLVPQLAPMQHPFHWSPIYLAPLDVLVLHLIGPPCHLTPKCSPGYTVLIGTPSHWPRSVWPISIQGSAQTLVKRGYLTPKRELNRSVGDRENHFCKWVVCWVKTHGFFPGDHMKIKVKKTSLKFWATLT